MNQRNIEIDKIRTKILKIKTLKKEHKTIYADFYELLDSLPLDFTFKVTNIKSDIDGYWKKTIYRNNSAWLKGDKILYNSSFFNFIDKVLDAIEKIIKSIKNMELEGKRKASAEEKRNLFIENLSRETFCEILEGLPSMFRFKLTNVRDDFDGYWEKTILDGKTAWRKDDRVLLSQFLFTFREEICDAIDREIGVYYKAKRNWEGIRKILFSDEAAQFLTKHKGEITLILTKEKLKKLYFEQNKSLEDIAKEYGCSRQAILKFMKKYGFERRTQSKARIEAIKKGKFENLSYEDIDEKFFSKWSPEMAWALGLLFTDGHVRGNLVQFTSVDIELLESVRTFFRSTRPVQKRTQSYDKSKHIYAFAFSHPKIAEDLKGLGLHEKKSLDMEFPEIPEEYMRHFIRGCWDGDGSVFLDKGKIVASYISGSIKFIERLVQNLHKIGIYRHGKELERGELWLKYPDGRFPIKIHKDKRANAFYFKVQSRENAERLFHYFYDGVDESMYLIRKYNVFLKGLNLGKKEETEQLTLDLDS